MIIKNQVSARVDQQTVDAVQGHLQAIDALLPFLLRQTPEERRTMLKAGDSSQGFIRKAVAVGADINEYLPRSFDLDEMRKDVDLTDQLYPLVLSAEKLYEKLSDTYAIAASEAYAAALLIYRTGKQLKTEDGLPPGVADLARRFRRSAEADMDADANAAVDADADAQANAADDTDA